MTRAADAMFLVGGRTTETELDPGTSSLGAVLELAGSAVLDVVDVSVPAPAPRVNAGPGERAATAALPERPIPRWRSLPIAPTALSDFAHCHRRFELVHLLGLPERARGRSSVTRDDEGAVLLDARAQGTLAHAVLERLATDAFLAADPGAVSRVLKTAGVPEAHPQHVAIAGRALRFLGSPYARALAERGATITREVAFVLEVIDAEARAVTLRGSMDLVVLWPGGSVDVVDYKSARSGDTDGYGFQLDVYALAAAARYPEATRLRAGLAFLGGGTGEPVWRERNAEADVRARIGALGSDLVNARWSNSFPRVAMDRCASIHCGFIGRCHPEA